MNGGFWCKYCGKQKAWDDRDYDFGIYLAVAASFEALEYTEDVAPYLICKQCADEAKNRKGRNEMRKNFDYPTQVVFIFNMGDYYERSSGIAYHNEIICGCCGGTFDLEDEFNEVEIEKVLPWTSLVEEISPEEDYGELEDSCDEDEEK